MPNLVKLVNKAIPRQMVTIVLTTEQCKAAGIDCKEIEVTTFVTDAGGVKRPKPMTKTIPAVLRVLSGEEVDVHESLLKVPKVQRAIARSLLRVVQGRSEVEPKRSRRREPTQPDPDPDTEN